MTRALRLCPPIRCDSAPMGALFAATHERLIDAIQAGRSEDAYNYARLLAFIGPRL